MQIFSDEIIKKLNEHEYTFIVSFFENLEIEVLKSLSIVYAEKKPFIHINFNSKSLMKCSFNIGLRLKEERRVNFFFGEFDAALLQYEQVEDINDEIAIIAAIEGFLKSTIEETKMSCNRKLKEVSYKGSEITYPDSEIMLNFKPYSRSYFICLKKTIETKTFLPWLNF
jgi:tRNA nucleotidyltransferase (CCA-adding enzyme)